MLLLCILYTAIFWVLVGALHLYNVAHYGPTPTEILDTKLGGGPGHIIASNVHGTIYVTIIEEQPGGKSTITTYTGPHLPSMWGDQASLDGIVVTVDVQPDSGSAFPILAVHLTGDMDYWHFYARPSATFWLVPANTTGGYKVTL
jgi:hypothetical protein